MYPNHFHNGNMNGAPYQYAYNAPSYTYYNPYQIQQPMIPNGHEPQYYGHPQQMQQHIQPIQPHLQQQMQPIYYPYVQQGYYPSIYFPQQNNNVIQQHLINTSQNHQRKVQEPKQPKTRIRSEVDPTKPEHSKEEIGKWIESRKRNYPSKANIARKEMEKKLKEETGEVVETPLSILEQKLRKKIRILSMIDSRLDRKKDFEKNYLFRCVTNPYKKVKTATFVNSEDNKEREGKKEKTDKIEKEGEKLIKKDIQEENRTSASKDVYDAFKEFQMQITQMENEKQEDEEEGDSPVERKIISQKSLEIPNEKLENSQIENNEEHKKKASTRPLKPIKKNLKKTPKPVVKATEEPKKSETIEEIIGTLKQRKENDEQEYIKILEGKATSSDFKYKSNTLLANLLIDSIYHEKQVILQCLRYIVKENFFDQK